MLQGRWMAFLNFGPCYAKSSSQSVSLSVGWPSELNGNIGPVVRVLNERISSAVIATFPSWTYGDKLQYQPRYRLGICIWYLYTRYYQVNLSDAVCYGLSWLYVNNDNDSDYYVVALIDYSHIPRRRMYLFIDWFIVERTTCLLYQCTKYSTLMPYNWLW